MKSSDILNYPINLLYAFITTNTYKSIIKYFGRNAANIIKAKANNQLHLINNYAVDSKITLQEAGNRIRNKIVSQYGLQPEAIIDKLLAGETVAGKNWKKGIYGVGAATYSDSFQGTSLQVDTDNGRLYVLGGGVKNYQDPASSTPIYANKDDKTDLIGYSYKMSNGVTYTVKKVKNADGSIDWWADTRTDTEGNAYFANGEKYDSSKTSNVWVDTLTSEDFMGKVLKWITNLIDKLTGKKTEVMSASNTFPKQNDMMTNTTKSSMSSILYIALIGGALMFGFGGFGKEKKNNKK